MIRRSRWKELALELRRAHGVHAILLYGSRARGDATPESDIDVVAFADVKEMYRDARVWNGMFLDAFVHPTADLEKPSVEMLKLIGARVLLDERGACAAYLDALGALERAGPPELPETELRMRRVWARKMLARIRRDDVEARYRRHWLLFQMLEDHFALRGVWYRGPKLALVELREAAPAIFAAYERALAPDATLADLEAAVACMVGDA